MFNPKIYRIYYIVAVLALLACNSDNNSNSEATKSSTNSNSSAIRLNPCPPLDSLAAYQAVRMQNYTYTGGKAIFGIQGLRLGSKTPNETAETARLSAKTNKGNHLHLNIDNKEHQINNQNSIEYHIPNGQHKLFAFIARSYYESIKNPEAIIAKTIEVRDGELVSSKNLPNVDIVYNAPRGLYKMSDSPKILLDFVLVNTNIEEGGNSVRITIDETAVFQIYTWQAYYIEGLLPGEHSVKLELLDGTDRQLAAPVSHKFVLTKENPES